MKSNPLLNDIAKGLWFMSFEGLAFWAPMAHKLMSGEKMELNFEPGALVTIFNENGDRVRMEDDKFDPPKNSVAVVDIVGALIKYGDWCTYGATEIVDALFQADRHPNIRGIVAYFDGPGGSVSSIAPFVDFGRRKTKPVVGLYDQCCSAHLYAMYSFCDYVMVENTISSLVGSIGIVMSFVENREYLKKLGYNFHDIYPKESEHKNEAFRLALEGKYDLIKKEMLSPMAIGFQEAVKKARGPKLDVSVPGILTGKTFLGEQALEYGFADGIGNRPQAMELALSLSEMKSL